jgi:hypothetical protein
MALIIDDAFIREWHPKYDQIENDEEYLPLKGRVAEEMRLRGTVSKETFLEIWKWKGAIRVKRHLRMDRYETDYATAIRRAASKPPEQMLAEILAPGKKLPGIGAPSGSTLLHFIFPDDIPIIDVRTVEVLYYARRLSNKQRDFARYEPFRRTIKEIQAACPARTLREIDRALFAYHKLILDKGRGDKSKSVSCGV